MHRNYLHIFLESHFSLFCLRIPFSFSVKIFQIKMLNLSQVLFKSTNFIILATFFILE